MSRTILINNVYSYRNKGDSAIVEAMMAYVRGICPGARIVLLSNFWKENQKYYTAADTQCAPHLWDIPMDDAKLRRAVRAVKTMLGLGLQTLHVPGTNSQTMDLYRHADLLLDAGGGSLYSSNRHRVSLGLYQHLFNLWFAKKIGKPVVLAPQSLGPFNSNRERQATVSVLRKLDCVMIRERISSSFLREYNVDHELVPDIAFLANFVTRPSAAAQRYQATLPTEKLFRVGVTVLDWRWAKAGLANEQDGENRISAYLANIAHGLLKLNETRPVHVSIFPQVTAGFGDTDAGVSRRLMQMLLGKVPSVSVAEEDVTPSDLCNLYSGMDAFLASRMHSAIFAISRGVPTMAMAYQPKTIGTFDLLNLGGYVKDIQNVTGEDIAQHLMRVAARYDEEKAKFVAAASSARSKVLEALDRTWKPLLTGAAVVDSASWSAAAQAMPTASH
jgi:colanic acid/amylovoran biosynthesis protein